MGNLVVQFLYLVDLCLKLVLLLRTERITLDKNVRSLAKQDGGPGAQPKQNQNSRVFIGLFGINSSKNSRELILSSSQLLLKAIPNTVTNVVCRYVGYSDTHPRARDPFRTLASVGVCRVNRRPEDDVMPPTTLLPVLFDQGRSKVLTQMVTPSSPFLEMVGNDMPW